MYRQFQNRNSKIQKKDRGLVDGQAPPDPSPTNRNAAKPAFLRLVS